VRVVVHRVLERERRAGASRVRHGRSAPVRENERLWLDVGARDRGWWSI